MQNAKLVAEMQIEYPVPLQGSPTRETLCAIKATSKLALWLHHLALQNSVANQVFNITGLHSSHPDALSGLLERRTIHGSAFPGGTATSVNHDVCGKLVTTNMIDEVDAHAARPFVFEVAVQAERTQMTLEFLTQ